MITKLSSKQNENIKQLMALLSQKKVRDELGLFAVEGAILCGDAVAADLSIEKAFVTEKGIESYPQQAKAIMKKAKETFIITQPLAHWAADTKTPQGLFAICKKLDNSTEVVKIGSDSHFLLLDNIQNPGNVGTIIRTAFALGVDGIFVSSDSADMYSPRVIRASMGSVFFAKWEHSDNMGDTVKRIQKAGGKVYSAALTPQAVPVSRELFEKGGSIILGNEGNGLSEQRIAQTDGSVVIPMSSNADSLNVAAAATILIWEMIGGKMQEKE